MPMSIRGTAEPSDLAKESATVTLTAALFFTGRLPYESVIPDDHLDGRTPVETDAIYFSDKSVFQCSVQYTQQVTAIEDKNGIPAGGCCICLTA